MEKFHAKSEKKQKIFFCIPGSKFQKILTLYICDRTKQRKKQKKILRRDTLRISGAVICRCTVKKVSLKILPPVYLHIIKIDIILWTTTCLNLFCRSINKNVMEWFLLIISIKYTLMRSTNLLSGNYSTSFLIKKRLADAQYLITNQLYD